MVSKDGKIKQSDILTVYFTSYSFKKLCKTGHFILKNQMTFADWALIHSIGNDMPQLICLSHQNSNIFLKEMNFLTSWILWKQPN